MNKKMVTRLASVSVVAAMAVAMSAQAIAVSWNPSRTQSEVTVTETTTTTSTGVTVQVSAAPAVDPATGAAVQVEQSSEVIIQVTPVSATLAANAALNATGQSAEQLAGQPTASGLSYAANGQLNALYDQVAAAESVTALLQTTAPAAAAEFAAVTGASAEDYAPVALYDIAASAGAAAVIAEAGSVEVAISVPGTDSSTQLVAICWDRAGNSRVVPVRVVNGVAYLTVTTSGPVMIMARAQA